MTRFSLPLFAIALSMAVTSVASAQSPVLAELYGRGVHAYYSGNTLDAHKYLTLAIDNGSSDPRAYYFRGVVNSATGRQVEAEEDWTAGAELEAKGEYGMAIGRALQRIQGSTRIQLENIRQIVRLENRATQAAQNRARYNDLKAAESEVLRGGAAASVPPPAAPPVEDNPFGDDAMGSEPVADEANNPFSDDPAGGAPAAGGGTDPFGAPAGGAAPADDPFGAPAGGAAPASSDPFGAPAAPASDPFGGGDAMAPAGGGADPFGGGAAPAGGAAPSGADPFGGAPAGGAAPAAGADPFGGDPFGGGASSDESMSGGAAMSGADPFGGDPFK